MYDADFVYSKLGALIKEPAAQEDVRELILGHQEFLKDMYLTLAINSGVFPYVGMQDFARFCKSVKLMDSVVTQSRLDYIVTGVKARPKGLDIPKLPG